MTFEQEFMTGKIAWNDDHVSCYVAHLMERVYNHDDACAAEDLIACRCAEEGDKREARALLRDLEREAIMQDSIDRDYDPAV
jgi:hypothetical protein